MSDLFGRTDERDDVTTNVENNGTLSLHQEELDVMKNRVQTGEVILSKEIIEEPKVMDIPVAREEVVIERRTLHEHSDSPINGEETIRIPVTEEKVEIGKHTIVTEEVSAYKREITETQHVEETLKREEAYIETTGDPHIVRNHTTTDEDRM